MTGIFRMPVFFIAMIIYGDSTKKGGCRMAIRHCETLLVLVQVDSFSNAF